MQDEHPPVGQGRSKLCLRPATVCDPAFRSGHFRSKVSLLSGNHGQNITLASKMSCPTTNFAKGSGVTTLEVGGAVSTTSVAWRFIDALRHGGSST